MLIFFELLGFLFITSSTLLFHFVDDIFTPNKFTDLLSINNNSVFENLKTVILPIIFWTFIEIPSMANNDNILIAKTLQLFVAMSLIYVIYYGYQTLTSKSSLVTKTIAISFANLIGFIVSYFCLSIKTIIPINLTITMVVLLIYIGLYIVLCYHPPKIGFFKDPESHIYGKK